MTNPKSTAQIMQFLFVQYDVTRLIPVGLITRGLELELLALSELDCWGRREEEASPYGVYGGGFSFGAGGIFGGLGGAPGFPCGVRGVAGEDGEDILKNPTF